MGRRLLIAVVVSLFLSVAALAGRPAAAAPKPAPHPSPAPHMSAPHMGAVHPNTGGAHSNAVNAGAQHNGAKQAAAQHAHMAAPHRAQAMLKAEVMARSSKVQHHLHTHGDWHHWHQHWVWGVYGILPVNTANQVVGVPNGNTLAVTTGTGGRQLVRLAGVAAPLVGQAFFSESKDNLDSVANGHYVRIFQTGVDPDGAMIGQVFLQDSGLFLNEKQIRDGMAWNSVDDGFAPGLASAEEEAQVARAGLWSSDEPIAPWLFGE